MRKRNHNSAVLRQDSVFTSGFLRWIESQSNSILLETTKPDKENFRSYVFSQPISIIQAFSLEQIESCLSEVESAIRTGYWVAGYIAYEAGYAFENVLKTPVQFNQPLMWFGVYEEPWSFNHKSHQWETGRREARAVIKNHSVTLAHPSTPLRVTPAAVMVSGVEPEAALTIQGNVFETAPVMPSLEESEYAKAATKIQQYIAEGDTYQVNFTFKVNFSWKDSAASLYYRLREAQHVGYSAFVNCGDTKILSFSPELFFRLDNNKLTLKPMKGTAPRGRTLDEDKQHWEELQASAKNHAENLMIVDLLRNDAGKIAATGSVTVPRFFDIERYQTVFQATSTVRAKLRPDVSASELIKNLFPCGSVTGAPKIRTMQIIRELEREPRGVYTGSIGFFSPKRKAQFNVAIRTIVLDKKQQTGEMGIGSGIIADSDIANEYEECLLKAKFLTEQPRGFQLFETIRWEPKKRWSLLP
ncbi:MAG: aminodeoxychorismate synthase component I, partial [Ignavibacteriales bacterium]|nr:aminodeoxychorismate synthase component I [Ignavibacteriales bacterium]